MSDRRIRLFVVGCSLSVGGAERFTSTLLSHIDRSRFELILCLLRNDISYPIPNDIPVKVLGKYRPWHMWRTIWRLRYFIEQIRPDIVLSTSSFVTRITGVALWRSSVQPNWVARIGGNSSAEDQGFYKLWHNIIYSRVNEFVANSCGVAEDFAKIYSFAAGRIRVVGNPTDFAYIDQMAAESAAYRHKDEIPLIVSVGRLNKYKRCDLLIDAFARVRKRMPAMLWICGDGPMRERLVKDIAGRDFGDSVKFFGFQKNPYALMRQATLFVMTSDREGLPNALIEAQGLGIPAVSTRCHYGPDEIIEEGKTGLLIEVGDATAVAKAIETLLMDPKRCEAMGKAARERTRQLYDHSILIGQWEEFLSKTMQKHAPCYSDSCKT